MKRIKRVLALILCGAMLVGNLPTPVFAEDLFQQGLCEHHLAHDNCGYQETIIGTDCGHEHTEECYTQVYSCVHQHGDCSYVESSDEITCDHQCTAENGCISIQLACCHCHDDQCGYAEPQESSPCTYVCEECIQQDSPVCTGALDCPVNEHDDGCEKKAADKKAAEDQAAADAVAALIDALPALEVIQAKEQLDQQEDYNQVQTAYDAYESLTEEQKTLLSAYDDFFRPYFEYFNSLTTTVWDGAGSSSSPYLIYTEESLRAFSESVRDGNSYSGLYFKLANDIELTEAWIPIGTADTYFCGIFDGNNYSISGLSATGDHIGLFAYVGAGAVIQNVTLDNLHLSGGPYLGGIAAYADASNSQISIANCKVYGTVNATRKAGFDVPNYGGGLIGYGKGTATNSVIIKGCTNYAYIDANSYTYFGGVGGVLNDAKVEGCINYGVVDGSRSADDGACFVGGICGTAGDTSFVGCANYGSITAFSCAGICDGGSAKKFSNCLNAGKIQHHSDGNGYALGYDGNNYENCYYSECGLTGGWYGNPEKTATKVTAEQLASGEVAYKLGTYFGQNIGVNQNPVRLTSGNKVHCVTVTGDTDYTIYVTNDTKAVWPGEMVDFILKNGEATFDKDSNITQDYNLTAVTVINGTCGDNLNWSFKGTSGVLTLTGTGAIDYYEDNTIPWGDFRSQVTTLILPEGLTKISYGAFRELPLTSVIIPDSVTEVGDYAFYDCKNLSTVDLGDGCSIGEYAFYHCPVQTLELGASHSFGIGSFNSNALTSITIGADSASFDNGAFWNCSNLTEIHFTGSAPQYVKDKGIMTETSLASFRDVTWYYDCNQEGWLTSSRYNAQNQTWAKYKLVSEKHVEVVDDAVTPTCTETGLTEGSHCSVCNTVIIEQKIIPARHSYGSDQICKYCDAIGGTCGNNLTWVLNSEGVLIISGSGAMYSYSYSKHAPWYEHRDLITSVILENGVTTISSYAFDYCQQLTRIEIPESVTSIGSDAFDQCTALVDVYITDISKWCTISFGNRYSQDYGNRYSNPMVYADNLYVDGVLATDIRLENGITQISDYAFYNCDTLTSVVIPDGVTSIGKYAFASCGNLKSVNIPDGVVRIEENTFAYCDNLTGVIIPDSVQYIETQAFYGCGLNSISIPASVISIGKNAFYCKAKEIQVSSDNPNYSSVDGVLLDKAQTKLIQMPYGFSGGFSIPDTVTEITEYACYDCYDLTAIDIPSSVTQIGKWALHDCESLTEVMIPNGITSIEEGVFDSCENLLQIIIPETVTCIGDWAFYSTALTQVFIPDSITSIGTYAFSGCDKLASVFYGGNAEKHATMTIKGNNEGLTNATWYYNSNIQSLCTHRAVILPKVEATCTENGLTEGKRCNVCSAILTTQNVIPAKGHSYSNWTVTTEPDCTKEGTERRTCRNCDQFETHNIAPTGHTEVIDTAIEPSCTEMGLTEGSHCSVCSATIVAQEVIPAGHVVENGICRRCEIYGTCGNNLTWEFSKETSKLIISGTGNMDSFSYPDYAPWLQYKEQIKTVDIKSGVTSIGTFAFRDYGNVETIVIPDSVTLFGDCVFLNCSSLKNIMIPDGTTRISNQMFQGCRSLISITIPDSVTRISQSAFSGCSGLASIAIPAGITKIEGGAFSNCSNLSGIWVDENNTIYSNDNNGVLFNKNKTTLIKAPGKISGSYTVPNSVTGIGGGAFAACKNLTGIEIPDGVTEICYDAFSNCSNLSSITLPDSIALIEEYTFSGCTNLKSVKLPNGLESIPESAFSYCTSLSSIELPSSIKAIHYGAFAGCSGLTSITLPDSLTYLGDVAFTICTSLREITFMGDAPVFEFVPVLDITDSITFRNVTATVYYPANNSTWTSSVMKNYGGNITWKPFGNPATKLMLTGLDPDTYLGQMLGREDQLGLRTVPSDATVDMVYTVSDSSILEIVEFTDSHCRVIAHKPGTVTVTATDKLSGISAEREITIVAPKVINVPFEEDIPITSNFVNRYYSFTPSVSGRYIFSSTACEKPYTDLLNIYIAKDNNGNLANGLIYPEEDTCQVYADLEAGTTYQIQPQYGNISVGRTANFKVEYLETTPLVSAIDFLHDSIECEWSVQERTYSIYSSLLPVGSTGTVVWKSSDSSIVEIKNSYDSYCDFIPHKAGSAVITASCNGVSNSVTIVVNNPHILTLDQPIPVSHNKGTMQHIFTFTPNESGKYVFSIDSGGDYYPSGISVHSSVSSIPVEMGYGAETLDGYVQLDAETMYYIGIGTSVYYPSYSGCSVSVSKSTDTPNSLQLRCVNRSADNSQFSLGAYFTPENTHEKIVKWEVSDESILTMFGLWNSYEEVFEAIGQGKVTITATSESGLTATYTYYAVAEGACDDGHDYDENHECVRCGAIGGTCGENATWHFEPEKGILTISGTGDFSGFEGTSGGRKYYWGNYIDAIRKIVVEDGITTVGSFAFDGCKNAVEVTFPDSVNELIYGTFNDCSSLKSIVLPGNISELYWTFRNCTSLTDVILPTTITEIGEGIFYGCSSLTKIDIPDNVTAIGNAAFANCTGFTEFTIPEQITEIGAVAFQNCTKLKTLVFEGDAPEIWIATDDHPDGQGSFDGCTLTAYYPVGNTTWTSDVMQDYGGTITWVPYGEVKNRVEIAAAELAGQTSIWIDGVEYAVQVDGENCYVDLPNSNAHTMVTYTYNSGSQNRYPIGMKVWILENNDGVYTATRAETFDNILQYSGMSIRVTGKKGIRMVTSIEKEKKNALVSGGLSGYTLKEYGTVVAWASKLADGSPLVLGQSYTLSNYAYKKGVADPVFAYSGSLMQYTNVLVNFTDEQCKYELALRPYMILEDAEGEEITLYGGIVNRSIGYIAYQNRNEFEPGTEEYNYIWDIIHYVYGDVYDDEFEHAWTTPKV